MVEELAEGLYKIPVPLPDNGLRCINTYLVRGDRDLLVDTGFDLDVCMQTLEDAFCELGVTYENLDVFASHLHPDHSGLVSRLVKGGARFFRSWVRDDATAQGETLQWEGLMNSYASLASQPQMQQAVKESQYHGAHKTMLRTAEDIDRYFALKDGDILHFGEYHLHCIETPGHHYSHICLYEPDKKLFFSGDHVLMGITPSISCFEEGRNPLKMFLESLDKVKDLEVDLVLPGHRQTFSDLNIRVEELKTHHAERLSEIYSIICAGRHTLFDISEQVAWSGNGMTWDAMSLEMKSLAIGETFAHANYLAAENKVVLSTGEDGLLLIEPKC